MGGAKNCPETPRQKMIGMMYLVLTAMLALNVSTDILNGFTMVEKSLRTSTAAADSRAAHMYSQLEYLHDQNPEKVGEWREKGKLLKQKSDSMYNYLHKFKLDLLRLSDGKNADTTFNNIQGKADVNSTGLYGINEGNGEILKKALASYKDFLLTIVEDTAKQANYEQIFATPNGTDASGAPVPWVSSIFDYMPLSAVITVLSKYQNDVKNAEAEMVQYLISQTDASDFRVNKLEALVIPASKYVVRGGKYSATIVLSAVDSTKKPIFEIGSMRLPESGLYEVSCNTIGNFTYSGVLRLPQLDGSYKNIPFKSDYTVGEPSVTISNTDLNIMYRGYDNNFSISVPGLAPEKVKIEVVGATSRSSNNKWIIRPNENSKTVTITVLAEVEGKMQRMGSSEYRVKALPRPSAYLTAGENNSYNEGNIPRNALIGDKSFIEASYGPDGLLDLNFRIAGFTLMTDYGTSETSGNKFSSEQLQQLRQLKKGSIVNIVNIRAVGPDGKETRLNAIALKMQ